MKLHQDVRFDDVKSLVLRNAARVRSILNDHAALNPRLFGSVARGESGPCSDIDILIDAAPECTLIKLALARDELGDILGRTVDLRTIREFAPADRIRIEAEAIAL